MNDVDPKDPDEAKFYFMDWDGWLNESATISTSVWATTLTKASDAINALVTRVKLSGGTHGTDYVVQNTITTSDGETLERSGLVRVRSSNT